MACATSLCSSSEAEIRIFSRPERFGKWPPGTRARRFISSRVKAMRRFCSTRKRLAGFAHLSRRPIAAHGKIIITPAEQPRPALHQEQPGDRCEDGKKDRARPDHIGDETRH